VLVEGDLTRMASDTFHPTMLRNATAFGASPRLRFDVVLNNLMGVAWTTGEVKMLSDGTPWRPLAHILDTTAAVVEVRRAPVEAIHAQISTSAVTIRTIASARSPRLSRRRSLGRPPHSASVE